MTTTAPPAVGREQIEGQVSWAYTEIARLREERAFCRRREQELQKWIKVTERLLVAPDGVRTRSGTYAASVRHILTQRQRPMRARELLGALRAAGHPIQGKTPRHQLVTLLATLRRMPDVQRAAKDQYVLRARRGVRGSAHA
jgi:hypothetical protein